MVKGRLEDIFYGMGIKDKLMLFIVAVIAFFVVINVVIVQRDYLILKHYSEDNQNYRRISELKNTLADNNRSLNAYFNESELKTQEGFNDSTLAILSQFNQTGYDAFDIITQIENNVKSLDEQLLIQSVFNVLWNYREEANVAIREQNNGIRLNQDKVNRMYAYINQYLDDLLERTAETREEEYGRLFAQWNTSKNIIIMLLIVVTILILMSGSLFSGYIRNSIRHIIDLHGKIGQGEFEHDIEERMGQDEVGQLNQSLQKMKKNIQEQIETLNEKALMERYLYQEALRNSEMEKALNEAKYAMLQSQINPHFLFNTLNIISRKAMFKDSEEAVRLIKALSGLFRHSLVDISEKVSMEKELLVVHEYLYIQKSRFGPRLTIEYKNTATGLDRFYIPPLIIQPVVENAIEHGIEPLEYEGHLTIQVTDGLGFVDVQIKDNGMGMDAAIINGLKGDESKPKGIGLRNVKERMAYFSHQESFFIDSSSEGTSVTLRFHKQTEGLRS